MTVAEQLDALRAAVPGCSLAAFGDLGARLVLRCSSDAPRPQESLDALFRQAADSYAMLDAAAIPGAATPGPETPIVVLQPGEARVFMRGADSTDAVLCICDSGDKAAQLAASAGAILSDSTGAQG